MIKILSCIFLALILACCQIDDSYTSDPLQETLIQKQQTTLQQQQKQKLLNKLSPWIRSQFQQLESMEQYDMDLENFSFEMQGESEFQFKWNPSKIGQFRIKIAIYGMKDNLLIFSDNPQESEYIDVKVIYPEMGGRQMEIGKVYCVRVFPIQIPVDYVILHFHKKFKSTRYIDIHLQSTGTQIKQGVSDKNFLLSQQESAAILKQLEQTQRKHREVFLHEYSLSSRQQRHQSQMLLITGVELIAILSTCLVQMYSIKSLIDNRAIV